MKITSFNPLIITKDSESVIALFEALGFERRHMKTGINDGTITSVRMRYTGEDGKIFHVDVAQVPVPRDMTSIRMNVRDFDEAKKMLEDHGFKAVSEETVTDSSSKSIGMISPSGFMIGLVEHIRH